MDKELYSKGELNVSIKDGNLVLTFDSKGVDVSAVVDTAYFLDKLKAAIPGQIDDAIFDVLKAAIKL